MLGSSILEVAIGMILVYLLVSLILTALTEIVATLLRLRSKTLWEGIRNLADDPGAEAWVSRIYEHPLIRGLSPARGVFGKPKGPSYIPSRIFALAVLDVIRQEAPPGSPEALAGSLERLRGTRLGGALAALAEDADRDAGKLKESIEIWFNHSMDRVSGWYKRKIQAVHLVAGLLLAVALNVDSILLMRTLESNSAVREALVSQAEAFAERPEVQVLAGGQAPPASDDPIADARRQLEVFRLFESELSNLDLPLGWTTDRTAQASQTFRIWPGLSLSLWASALLFHLAGWVVTALAASLGAPFWFDMLNKVISIRSVGRAPEEKPKKPREVQEPTQPGQTPAEAERVRADARD